MADLAFFYASAMIQTALPFYLTVLLCEPITLLTFVIGGLVVISLIWYLPTAILAAKFGKKRLIISAMLFLALIFLLLLRALLRPGDGDSSSCTGALAAIAGDSVGAWAALARHYRETRERVLQVQAEERWRALREESGRE